MSNSVMPEAINSKGGKESPSETTYFPASTDQEIQVGHTLEANTDGYYGWVCVVGVFLINAHSWGINTSYSVFLSSYLEGSDLRGASTLNFAFVGGLLWGVPLLISPVVVRLMKIFGTRLCLFIGVALECGSLIGAPFATDIWNLYLGQGIGFALGVGFFLVSTQNIIVQWFSKRRSLAAGLAVSGTGIGGLVYSLAAGHLIQHVGTGMALRVLAIIAGCATFVGSMLVKDNNHHKQFIVLLFFASLNMLGEIIILTQLSTYATSVLSLTTTQASIIGSMICCGQVLGRIAFGYASDILGRLNVAAMVTLLAGLWTLIVWPLASSYAVLIFYCVFVGGFAGSFWAVIGPVTAEAVGVASLPTGLSMVFGFVAGPCVFSPVIGLELASGGSSYMSTQMFAGFMYIGSAVFVWALRCWKIGLRLDSECEDEE